MEALKNFGKGILFLAIVVLHIYFSREALVWSWVTPLPCALLFTAAVYGLRDLGKPWKKPTDQQGVTAVNGSRVILLLMTIVLYGVGFIDRG